MEILEKLYDCVDEHLYVNRDWDRFALVFKSIYQADLALYRAIFEPGNPVAVDYEEIASSNKPLMVEYKERKMFQKHRLSETSNPVMKPFRRSDFQSDEDYKTCGAPIVEWWISKGWFYYLAISTQLMDGTYLGLVLWRDEDEEDFSEIERQRLAFVMRYIRALIRTEDLTDEGPLAEVKMFGRKYGLTDAEVEILAALIAGQSLRYIAENTARSYGTVRWHVQNILDKCHVNNQRNLLNEFYKLAKQ